MDIDKEGFPFAVVEFTGTTQVEAVPSIWLSKVTLSPASEVDDDQVMKGFSCWPRVQSKVDHWIRTQKNPYGQDGNIKTSEWEVGHEVKILKICSSLSQAKKKRDKAEVTDNLDTSDNEVVTSRLRRAPGRFIVSSDSEVDGPNIKKLKLKVVNQNNKKTQPKALNLGSMKTGPQKENTPKAQKVNNDTLEMESLFTCSGPSSRNFGSGIQDQNNNHSCTEEVEEENNITPSVTPIKNCKLPAQKPLLHRMNAFCVSPRRARFSPKKTPQGLGSVSGASLRYIMREIADIKNVMRNLSLTVNKIWAVVAPPLERPPSNNFPTLPLKDQNNMDAWHKFLEEPENFYSPVNLLATHGSGGARDSVYCMMKTVLTDELGQHYNAQGKNRENARETKMGLQDTLTFKAIKVAMKKHVKDYNAGITDPAHIKLCFNSKAVLDDVGRWLKDCRTRLSQKRKRELKAAAAKLEDSDE